MGDENLNFEEAYLTSIQDYLKDIIDVLYSEANPSLHEIFYYHLGLNESLKMQGKRIRPMLTLLCAAGAGAEVRAALPAAASIELIHNFSLIHDDIDDNSEIRRGKKAVWKRWGLARGLNAGDAMFNAAFLVLSKLCDFYSDEIVQDAYQLLFHTCHHLTIGQDLDIRYEKESHITVQDYFKMIEGKTAALIACSTEMGSILGYQNPEQRKTFHEFGKNLGIAFQIYDDWLGIWGREEKTGKSSTHDLIEKKKTYPILLGLARSKEFVYQFSQNPIDGKLAQAMKLHLSDIGVETDVKQMCEDWTNKARDNLYNMECHADIKEKLVMIADKLLIRSR